MSDERDSSNMQQQILQRRQFLGTIAAGAASAVVLGNRFARADDHPPKPNLAFTAAGKEFHFDTGALRGTLPAEGKWLGLRPVTEIGSGKSIAGRYGLFSPYRLLTSDARFGTAAWDWASQARLLADGAVEVQWTADKEHPLDMTAVYRFAAPNTLDFSVTVKPRQDLKRFELFLASYFDGFLTSAAYVADNSDNEKGGTRRFMGATRNYGDWQMFPRDEEAIKTISDGRWKRPPHPVEWKIRPKLAAPLAVRRDEDRNLTAVLMAPAEDCFAVSMPYGEEGHRSVYLSLFGGDLKADEKAAARARLVIGREISNKQAVGLYEQFAKNAKG